MMFLVKILGTFAGAIAVCFLIAKARRTETSHTRLL